MYPENNDYKLYYAQSLYQACLYDESFQVTKKIVEDPEYKGKVTKLQAAIKYSQEDVLSAKSLVNACPNDEPDKEVNLGCLLYKVLAEITDEGATCHTIRGEIISSLA